MTEHPALNPLKSKKTGYCVTEIKAMVNVIFENAITIQHFGGTFSKEIFEQMANSTEGKRTSEQMELWLCDLKKIRELEKRFTKIVQQALSPEEQEQLHRIIFAKGPQQDEDLPLYPLVIKEKSVEPENSEGAINEPRELQFVEVLDVPSKKKKRIGCLSFFKREKAGCPSAGEAYGAPLEALQYQELGAENSEAGP